MVRRVRTMLLLGSGLMAASVGACDREPAREDETGETVEVQEVEALDPRLAQRLPPGATMETAEEGRRLFIVCAVCHGLDARGTQLGPSLRDGEWISISGRLEEIEEVIRTGVPEPEEFPIPMPVMGGGDFTPAQVRALATYVYAISREPAAP